MPEAHCRQIAPLVDDLHAMSTIAHAIYNSPNGAYAVDSVDDRIAYIAA